MQLWIKYAQYIVYNKIFLGQSILIIHGFCSLQTESLGLRIISALVDSIPLYFFHSQLEIVSFWKKI